ncbi:unnamed protein product [Diatraea saccharalis]|uniref:Ommochrome-binding protein n=1 Tax=Diatraea saccharalis TaxID=40085 RepID=A0A9N9N236_9NEOP|nr:unnamed protein product [Diatraea saccharalis]
MKLQLLLIITHTVFAQHDKDKKERILENIDIDHRPHERKIIIDGIDRPYQLAYHAKENRQEIVYFSYNCGLFNESTFEVGYAVNGTPVPVPIKGVKNGFATAINVKDNVIYYGGSDGIYRQNLSDPISEVVHLEHKYNVWDLFYKDHLYFITFPKKRLYKYKTLNYSEIQTHIREKIYQFAIDGEGDTFITNKTGLFMIKNGTNHRIHIKGATVFRAIAVNKKGEVHLCGRNEIYVVHKTKRVLREIAKIKNIFGLTFDIDNNIIYSDPHQIVRLVPAPGLGQNEKNKKSKIKNKGSL